jgi:hypothetical protein
MPRRGKNAVIYLNQQSTIIKNQKRTLPTTVRPFLLADFTALNSKIFN